MFNNGLDFNLNNIHKRILQLDNELYIGGIGGSVPAVYETNHKKEAWPGFPYNSENDI